MANTREEPRLTPVETQRASEAIYEQIKALIISGQYRPGDRLPSERAMMEMLQRSRHTIREALRKLEQAGFIRIAPGSTGAVVQALSTDSVAEPLELLLQTNSIPLKDLVDYRSRNDAAVARLAARNHNSGDIARLSDILDRSEALFAADDFPAFTQQDAAFHEALAQAGKNQVSFIISKVLSRIVEPMIGQVLSRQSPREKRDMCRIILQMHRSIFDAVRRGDEDQAEQAMAQHIREFYTVCSPLL